MEGDWELVDFKVLSNPNYSIMCLNYVIQVMPEQYKNTWRKMVPTEGRGAEHLPYPVYCHSCPSVTRQAYNEDLLY